MIRFIIDEMRRQGVVVPESIGTATMVAACEAYGGERLYVPKLPKLQNMLRLASATTEAAIPTSQLTRVTGLSRATVKRLRRR